MSGGSPDRRASAVSQSPPKTLRIAWSAQLGCGFAIDADVREAIEVAVRSLEADGYAIEIADPAWPAGTAEYPLLALQQAGLAALHGAELAARRADIDPDLVAQIELGLKTSGAEIARVLLKREEITRALGEFFQRYDLLLCPTAPVTAWPLWQLGPRDIGGRPATVVFKGLAPGLAGLYQINLTVPANAPIGASIPLAIETPEAFHDMVDIAITN